MATQHTLSGTFTNNNNNEMLPMKLSKMYCAPIKQCDIPSNNPFYNGSLVQDTDKQMRSSTSSLKYRTPNYSYMSKNQQSKVKNMLL